jgi:hypothetical protein
MLSTEIKRKDSRHIDDFKDVIQEAFPSFSLKDYTLNDMWMLKRKLQKHEIKIYEGRIFVKSMIDANSSSIALPLLIYFGVAFLINEFFFKSIGLNYLYPIFISTLLGFFVVPAFINIFSLSFKNKLDKMHQAIVELIEDTIEFPDQN